MKKIFTVGIAIGCLLSLCACQATTSQQHSETTALTTEEVKTGIGTLQNQMSEQEQKRVSVGALTLLGQNTADASSSEQPVVEVELWDNLDYLNWMHNKPCPSIEEMIAESRKQATQNIVISRILDGMPAEKIAEGYEVSLDYVKQLTHQLKMDIEEAKAKKHKETGSS